MVKLRIKVSDEIYSTMEHYPNIDWNKVALVSIFRKLEELKSK